jgi:C_GCAxxG_C_C family probable redox protein
MEKREEALKSFSGQFNCSQSVFNVFAEELGLTREQALKVSCGFGGGMARMGKTCGAVTGAFMAISLKYGKWKPEDNEARDLTYSKIQQFVEEFEKKHKSTVCSELLGCDYGTAEGRKFASENDLHSKVCNNLVSDAVEIVEELFK